MNILLMNKLARITWGVPDCIVKVWNKEKNILKCKDLKPFELSLTKDIKTAMHASRPFGGPPNIC